MAKTIQNIKTLGIEVREKPKSGDIHTILDLGEVNKIISELSNKSSAEHKFGRAFWTVLQTLDDAKVAVGDKFSVQFYDAAQLLVGEQVIEVNNVGKELESESFNLHTPIAGKGSLYLRMKREIDGESQEVLTMRMPIQFLDSAAPQPVTMKPFTPPDTDDKSFWEPILSKNIDFNQFQAALDNVLYELGQSSGNASQQSRSISAGNIQNPFDVNGAKNKLPFIDADEYAVIKFATADYIRRTLQLEFTPGFSGDVFPYYSNLNESISDILSDYVPRRFDTLDGTDSSEPSTIGTNQVNCILPVELIWSYWMEQAMLVQSMNAISLRFQNMKGARENDPLARFDTSPLRQVSRLLWSYISDEQHRTTLFRRVHEYGHAYDLKLIGKAVPETRTVDNRSQFLAAFHNLLHQASIFYKDADDMTRRPDGFPVLTALREVHLLLAAGNHNAYFSMTLNTRSEMLIMQYILARQEMRLFLGGRPMVPYPESWMDRLDTMKSIQGWDSTSVLHYYDLAHNGEKLLLAIRYGDWTETSFSSDSASNWAFAFRDHVQKYLNAYRVVTGVNLSSSETNQRNIEQRALQPAVLIQKRLAAAKQPEAMRLNSNGRPVLRSS